MRWIMRYWTDSAIKRGLSMLKNSQDHRSTAWTDFPSSQVTLNLVIYQMWSRKCPNNPYKSSKD